MALEHPPAPVAVGDVIAGKYRVTGILGSGGMGVVVSAVHETLGSKVALKFLLKEAAAYPEVVARFAREARAAAQIQSDHVARVMDVGTLEGGAPYLVMEHLDGHDLQEALALSGPMPIPTAVGYILEACEAIAEAHTRGIIHRDLKPANLFLARRANGTRVVKVLDFGISKLTVGMAPDDITKTNSMIGSPAYMGPEQFKAAKSVDARVDQWSLGVILYELLTGSKPFTADTFAEVFWVIVDNPHPPVRTLRPEIPAALAAVIDRALEKDPAKRFPNVAAFAAALSPFGPDGSDALVDRISHVMGVDAPPAKESQASEPDASESAAEAPPTRPDGASETPLPPPEDMSKAHTKLITDAPWSTTSGLPAATPVPSKPARASRSPWIAAGVGAAGAVAVIFWMFVGSRPTPGNALVQAAATSATSAEPANSVVPLPPATATTSPEEAPPSEADDSARSNTVAAKLPPLHEVTTPPPPTVKPVHKPKPSSTSAPPSLDFLNQRN